VASERPLSAWSDRRVAEHGRAICQQRALPTHPGLAGEQATVLEEWAQRWQQRGPHDIPGQVELGLVGEIAAELRRVAPAWPANPAHNGRPTMNADQPTQPVPRRLGEDRGLPGDFLVGFTRGLMERREQLVRDGQPPEMARERAVAEAVQSFAADADQRGWTVSERRIASLAGDTLGLEDEYRDRHGYEPELARLYAVGEVLEGERIRGEIPSPWWREDDPPQRPDPDRARAAAVRADASGRPRGQRSDAGGRP